jgi:hypothetical protein
MDAIITIIENIGANSTDKFFCDHSFRSTRRLVVWTKSTADRPDSKPMVMERLRTSIRRHPGGAPHYQDPEATCRVWQAFGANDTI